MRVFSVNERLHTQCGAVKRNVQNDKKIFRKNAKKWWRTTNWVAILIERGGILPYRVGTILACVQDPRQINQAKEKPPCGGILFFAGEGHQPTLAICTM
jgi:hypothetical protein